LRKLPSLPDIPEREQTPTVKALLGLLEECIQIIQKQGEEIEQLKDEVRVLKGEKKRPAFKPSQLDKETDKARKKNPDKSTKRPGSDKRSKNAKRVIHEDIVIQPTQEIPQRSRFKGYRDFVVQDLKIESHNTRYRLARWVTPDGETLIGQLPNELNGQHFGPHLVSYILYQYHHCQVTQPLLLEQLREWRVAVSAGEMNALLSSGKDSFHREKNEILSAGLTASGHITVDDSGTRHKGNNGYVTHMGNDAFAWFQSTLSKSRINFLELLCSIDPGYRVNDQAQSYWQKQKLPAQSKTLLAQNPKRYFSDAKAWEDHLDQLGITHTRHRRSATEGALLGNLQHNNRCRNLVVVSDDAGQFNLLQHALCWVHTERLVHTMNPLNDNHRQDIAKVRGEIWDFYAQLKRYKSVPDNRKKKGLANRFDDIFQQKTRYQCLNRTLKRIHANKTELLLVLERPDIPLHTNGSEGDIRDYVKKRKVSGGTRSDLGRQCRDTFISLKKTCRKQKVSFWQYLLDRLKQTNEIPWLPDLIADSAPGY
jgi:hypothetical protein